ncbi:Z-ring associated protein ZapG [Salinivibrio costicola]|uniref:Z-ring associated protein ZapG n=1 Tax=Salinivibrio costicola TaxID=51367 RepID=UPI0003958C0E|nr:Z-ring associated protein ZapG [Salinivibrio costicola]
MAWINSLIFLVIGIAVGFFIARMTTRDLKQQKNMKRELEKSRYELEQYRQELVDHFAQSAELLDTLSKDYNKLYQHMAKTSSDLMPDLPDQDNPFAKRLGKITNLEVDTASHPPRDYSGSASGLLKSDDSPRAS